MADDASVPQTATPIEMPAKPEKAKRTRKSAPKAATAPATISSPRKPKEKAELEKVSGRKVAKYSDEQKAEKLKQIEGLLKEHQSTLKDAAKKAGISEQTYYIWKKNASAEPPASLDLSDLIKLEEENQRLRKLLAERLRTENAELRKRLGLG